jgi:hypothetical protein
MQRGDALVILKASSKLVDHNRSEYRLSGSRNTWAKEFLLVGTSANLEATVRFRPVAG